MPDNIVKRAEEWLAYMEGAHDEDPDFIPPKWTQYPDGSAEAPELTIVRDLLAEVERLERLYMELVYEVVNVVPGETRHETARRIIHQHETLADNGPTVITGRDKWLAKLDKGPEEGL